MYFSTAATIVLGLVSAVATAGPSAPEIQASEAPCHPFRVHRRAALPAPPPTGSPASKNLDACIAYYTSMDINKNGVSDWTADLDGRRSSVLFPNDPDIDGDGIENVLDPDPLNANIRKVTLSKYGISEHLSLQGPTAQLQGDIFQKYGMIAIDHTDAHSSGVLQAIKTILEALPTATRKQIKSIKYFYAFSGHDPKHDIAGYHRIANAISIGGLSAYGEGPLNPERQVAVLSAIAHEIGHAFLFDSLTPKELSRLAHLFGGWPQMKSEHSPDSFYDKSFFAPHPLQVIAARSPSDPRLSSAGLISQYATTNKHEWFAEAFAANLMQRLGESGQLGQDWRKRLSHHEKESYWVDYTKGRRFLF